jgi:DNA repair protein RecN (Recombination protein N)
VLEELRVENLLLIERAELRLGAGLNVLTGETGAGKTVLAHALDLLLGGKPRAGIVRPGASEAYVEGVFELGDSLRSQLGDRIPADAEELVLARRVSAEGRTRAYLNGRSATAADLREVGGRVLSFYGQHEHRKLTLAAAQLEILDGFCGPEHAVALQEFARLYARERELRDALAELRERTGARDRELDLLEWEIQEIEAAAPDAAEEDALTSERERLRNLEGLRHAAAAGIEALAPESGEGAVTAVAGASRSLDAVRGIDPALDALAERVETLAVEADDLARELRRYGEAVDAPPGRLDEVEERLTLFDRLKRKHGGTVAAVLAHAQACRVRRDELAGAEEALEEAAAALAEVRAGLAERAAVLRRAREQAAEGLARAVVEVLEGLAMEGASFEVRLAARDAYGPSGGDEVEFMIAPNPGVPPGRLRDTASGGELSRLMLALMSVAAAATGPGTLVFDEVDAGIGGQTARAVGEQLRVLAGGRQVICITHLAQIASMADRHFTIVKDASVDPARTTVTLLGRGAVVGELVRMLGADGTDAAARRHAKELLKAA